MSQWWKPIRDRIQRAVFNQQRQVLRTLAENGGWMTYIEVAFNSHGKVSSDNALTVLYEMRDWAEPPLVDFAIRRAGSAEVGSFWAINVAGREFLRKGK